MKVKKLYILCLNNWSWLPASEQTKEINGGTKALYEKYVLRLEESNVCLVNYTQNGMFKPLELAGQFQKLPDDENTGMYIFGHTEGAGVAGTVGGCDPQALAKVIKGLGITKLRKLCLVACNAAKESASETQANLAKGDPSYLTRLCAALAMPGLKIAGWNEFVTVCQPDRSLYKSSGKKYTEEEKKETRLGDSKEKVCLFGKKVVQRRGKEMLVREEDRTGMKRAYIWKEEKVYVATDDWHDKE